MAKNVRPTGVKDFSPSSLDKIHQEVLIKQKFELTEKQKQILNLGIDKNTRCLILDGCAGVSKTWIAVLIGLQLLNAKKICSINYLRTLVQSKDSETGFLVGDLDEKTKYYNTPFYDKLSEFLIKPDLDRLIKENRIRTYPTSMLRGVTEKNCVTIFDENQNALLATIETVMTRMSEHSLLILCGDSSGSQNDLGQKSGFKKICEIFNDEESRQNGVFYIKLDSSDVVRSKFVRYVVEKFEKMRGLLGNYSNGNGNGNGNSH